MTAIPLLNGNFKPSQSDLNNLILQLNAIFANVAVSGDQSVSGNLTVAGSTTLTGDAALSGALSVTGASTLNGGIVGGSTADIAINTNKFTVTASSGNALVAGTLVSTGVHTANGGVVTTGLRVDATTTISAAGTSVSDATALAASVNNVTTVSASTAGVKLPACAAGKIVVVNNLGANSMHVYGAGSDTVDGAAAATGVVLTNTKRAIFVGVSATAYISLMGIPSA